ncbi:relaxase/mobilization nuclease domain-containing protein [Jannaschia marina]|uniref:relaxase/mobilization nuclease domain-containing protein n=1 Tax=Jannaschia marina TaxID=2741674 RepID=UPI0015CC47E4|nr:relaxase/mobilization nuclease domain-containing protein [Jannaschia marina]
MILKASQRAGAVALADHLMNDRDNDHVTLGEIRGFVAGDLHGGLREAHAISKATRCTQYLFQVSLNPPQDARVDEHAFYEAADRIEAKLGLEGQPRAVVFHEKEGRRHAHVVWSRIDADSLTAINLPHFRTKLRDVARELYLDHGWALPDGLATYGNRNPLNFTLEEWQQAKRLSLDPREIKQAFRDAWARSDDAKSLTHALEERGYYLAKGDRRGIVAVGLDGSVFAFGRWAGLKAREVKAKLPDPSILPSVDERQDDLRRRLNEQALGYISTINAKHAKALAPLILRREVMSKAQREERAALRARQAERWRHETAERMAKLNGGMRGLFDRLTGKAKQQRLTNEKDAWACARRDQTQRDDLIAAQIKDRRVLQHRFKLLRDGQARDRKALAQDITRYLRRSDAERDMALQRETRRRDRGFDLSR